jgi:hypothetical protein
VFHDAHTATWKGYGIRSHTFLASADACPNCLFLNGETVRIGEPFIVLTSGRPAYRVVLHPPLHPQCVLAETPVLVPGLIAATHAEYQGPVVRLEFGDGSRVAVTPNHMLLTPTGFARAQDLMEGDDVFSTGPRPVDGLPAFGGPDDDRRPARADEVFGAAAVSPGVTLDTVPVAPEYFHGDAAGVHGEVNVVRSYCLLRDDLQPGGGQPVRHFSLIPGLDDAPGFLRRGDLTPVFEALLDATARRVGRFRELAALLWGQARGANGRSFGTPPDAQSEFLEAADDDWTADAQRLRNAQNAFPGTVTTTKVIRVHRETLRHPVPVYDFETRGSMYLVGRGIISSNCGCTTVPADDGA